MDDPRCCGTGTCIINAEGFCWCGQRWDGERMCFPTPASATGATQASPPPAPASAAPGASGTPGQFTSAA